MSLLGRIFGGKAPAAPAPPAPSEPVDPAQDPNMIRVFDGYGREMFVPKAEWRDKVLMGHLQKVWNEPDGLFSALVQALQDGFAADLGDAAKQLAAIDPDPERGAVVLANVLREQGRGAESAEVLRRHIERHGESGLILTNLAKVQDGADAQLRTLWRGLELDPNGENAVGWYQMAHREQGGPEAGLEALRRIAALPGSWRAQMWLGRAALENQDLPMAMGLYRQALERAPRPAPPDLLMQVSGDLGKAGHLEEILRLVEPAFILAVHGLQVGNNLIKANLDLGRLDAANELVQGLYAQHRPDWKQTLSFWDNEIAKARAAATPVDEEGPMEGTLLTIEGPVWLPEASPARTLFPKAPGEAVEVVFLGGSAEVAHASQKPVHQVSDAVGRLSRALPLFLAEQVQFRTSAQAKTLQPWLMAPHSGFILQGETWTDADAAGHARQVLAGEGYVVITHLKAAHEPWEAELRLVRAGDGACVATARASFPSDRPLMGIPRLAEDLLKALTAHAGVGSAPKPGAYQVPGDKDFIAYLVRMEQLLAVRCSNLEGTKPGFLSGERDILDGNLQLCLNQPGNPTARILLLQTCLSMKIGRPEIVEEYRGRIGKLQAEHPLLRPAREVVEGLFGVVFCDFPLQEGTGLIANQTTGLKGLE